MLAATPDETAKRRAIPHDDAQTPKICPLVVSHGFSTIERHELRHQVCDQISVS